jgi:AraC-like DNA-binding protein
MEQISGAAMRELDDEALGWFSRRLPWGSYGMLARASITSPNLEVAIKRWCRHHRLLTEDIALTVAIDHQTARVNLVEQSDLGPLRELCLVSVLRNLHGVACWLVDSRIPLQSAQFPFPTPAHKQVYSILFTGSTRFQQPEASMCFDSSYLKLPILRDEAALQHMLQRALPLTVLQYSRDRLLMHRVRQLLINGPLQSHNADAMAQALNVSTRTLHRQLKDEGTSLQTLKDDVRLKSAKALLLRSNRPLKQVAEASGFLNEKSFIRAFKSWTNMSPGEFRSLPHNR